MTLAAIHHDAIKACLAIPGNMEKLCEGLDRKNLNNGLIQPQKTIRAYVPDQVGEENANQGERVIQIGFMIDNKIFFGLQTSCMLFDTIAHFLQIQHNIFNRYMLFSTKLNQAERS